MPYKKHITEIDTDLVIEIVCGYLKVNDMHIFENVKENKIVHARFMVFFVLARIFKVDLSEIANIFNMSHGTVFYGSDKILSNIVLYNESKTEYNDIRKLIIKRINDIIIIPTACAIKNGNK